MIDSELFPCDASKPQSLRLFCFPHAGGGTSQFYRWRRHTSKRLAILPARLPGRESRLQQPPVTSLTKLATTVSDTIRNLPPGPFALLGYSVGAYLAYQVASRLPRHGAHAPLALVVVASNAPGSRKPSVGISELPDDEFIDHIHNKYGGIPAIVRQDPSWLAAVIPALRADLRMLETHRFEPAEPLACPLLAVGGRDDLHVTAEGLSAWGAVTRGKLTTQQFPGGHFFLYPDFHAAVSSGHEDSVAKNLAPLDTVFQFVQRGDRGAG